MATDTEITEPIPLNEAFIAAAASRDRSVVLHAISWDAYLALREMPENQNIRMTYDRGELEIMSPSRAHEAIAELLGILIEIWSLELDVGIAPCGMMTIKRVDLDLGFEPDKCYYVQHEPQMRDEEEIDFAVDPPPDLAIEVKISHKLANKMRIYAAFGVPELWHCRGRELEVYELAAGGNYVSRETSICFPNLPIAKIDEIVRQLGAVRRTTLTRSFRNWVRDNFHTDG